MGYSIHKIMRVGIVSTPAISVSTCWWKSHDTSNDRRSLLAARRIKRRSKLPEPFRSESRAPCSDLNAQHVCRPLYPSLVANLLTVASAHFGFCSMSFSLMPVIFSCSNGQSAYFHAQHIASSSFNFIRARVMFTYPPHVSRFANITHSLSHSRCIVRTEYRSHNYLSSIKHHPFSNSVLNSASTAITSSTTTYHHLSLATICSIISASSYSPNLLAQLLISKFI